MWCLHCSALWSYVSAAWCSNFQLKKFSYRWWNWLSTGQIKYNIWLHFTRALFEFASRARISPLNFAAEFFFYINRKFEQIQPVQKRVKNKLQRQGPLLPLLILIHVPFKYQHWPGRGSFIAMVTAEQRSITRCHRRKRSKRSLWWRR